MFLATMETQHFSFQALGADEDAAERAIHRGWVAHCRQYDAYEQSLEELRENFGINVHPIEMNECLRDGTPLGVK